MSPGLVGNVVQVELGIRIVVDGWCEYPVLDAADGDDPFDPNNGLLGLAALLRRSGLSVQLLDLHMPDLELR